MIYRKNGRWELANFLVKYTDNGEAREEYVESPDYLQAFADRWDHLVIDEIIEVEPTEEQIARFNTIANFPEDFKDVYAQYVLEGLFVESSMSANHPFKAIQIVAESEIATNINTELAMGLLMAQSEISELKIANLDSNNMITELLVEVMTLREQVAELILKLTKKGGTNMYDFSTVEFWADRYKRRYASDSQIKRLIVAGIFTEEEYTQITGKEYEA